MSFRSGRGSPRVTAERRAAKAAHIALIKDIQASLFLDARDLLKRFSCVPRYVLDGIHREMCHRTHAEIALEYKEFNKRLASEWDFGERPEIFGYTLPINGDPDSLRTIRQWVGFFSREHASVSNDIIRENLAAAAKRLGTTPSVFSITPRELYAIQAEVENLIGPTPPLLVDLIGKHGPGAVATGEKGFQKYHFSQTYLKIDALIGGDSECLFRLPDAPPLVLERTDPTTRIVTVPKDATSTRIISAEPLSMQFLEQGLKHWFYARFKSYRGNPVPLEDQSVQRRRAQEGSFCTSWGRRARNCTIDLTDASDSIKCCHVRMLFPKEWQELLFALRSEYARFPGGGLLKLETFAPMGSAICYPIECIVFLAAARAAARLSALEGDRVLVSSVGDDIICPAYSFHYTLDLYSRLGFVPNVRKCCGPNTRFREACGGDYWDGVDVGINRPRIIPAVTPQGWGPMATLATRMSAVGFEKTANAIAHRVKGPVALGSELPYFSPRLKWPRVGEIRYNTALQRLEQQTVAVVATSGIDVEQPDGWESLFQWFTSRWDSETSFSDRTRTVHTWLPVTEASTPVRTYTPKIGYIGRRRVTLSK
jgi:hypothetical protein